MGQSQADVGGGDDEAADRDAKRPMEATTEVGHRQDQHQRRHLVAGGDETAVGGIETSIGQVFSS